MKAWATKTLGEICKQGDGRIQTGPFGSQLHQSDYRPNGTPVVMPADISDGKITTHRIVRIPERHVERLKRHKLGLGDIVYGRRGDIGRQALVRKECVGWLCGTGCLRISLGRAPVRSDFLHRYLATQAVVGWIEGQAVGATMPNLNTGILERVPVVYPESLKEQSKIAAVLSAYDDLIENNQRRIVLLEQMAEQLYREWFVRMRFPGHSHSKSEDGVPSGWTKGRFRDLCVLQRGFDLPDSNIVAGEHPVVASTSIKAYHNQFKVEPPVITTGRSGSLGEVLWIDEKAWPLNTALFVKSFLGNSPFFVFHTLRTMRLENFNSGAGVPSLNRNHLNALPMMIPSPKLQQMFADRLGPMHALKNNLVRACLELEKARDLLLPRLISGKLRVADLDIQFPPSMQTLA